MNSKKGIFLIDSLSSGGAQRQFVELIKGIVQTDITPIVVVYHNIPFFEDELISHKIQVIKMLKKDKLGITFLPYFFSFLRRIEPLFIHSFLNIPNFYARLAKLFKIVSIIITSERNTCIVNSNYLSLMEKLMWPLSDHIIVNAHAIRNVLVKKLGISSNKVSIIPNGIDVNRFRFPDFTKVCNIRRQANLLIDRGYLIGIIGRLAKQKNHGLFLDALSIIKTIHPEINFKAVFWGEETEHGYKRFLDKKISSLGLNDRILFLGIERDMASVYAACDLIVLPSLWEGTPNVILEAMAAGRIVIASDVSDNSSIIKDKKNGFLFSEFTPQSLAEKIVHVLTLPKEVRKGVEIRARDYIASQYSIERMVSRTMSVYSDVGII